MKTEEEIQDRIYDTKARILLAEDYIANQGQFVKNKSVTLGDLEAYYQALMALEWVKGESHDTRTTAGREN